MTHHDYFSGDIKILWQDQISEKIDFDHGSFMGALSDLQSDPDWKQAFSDIENATGMPEFLNRLQQHFDLCMPSKSSDGSVYVYQHPSRTEQSGLEKDTKAMLELMRRHLDSAAEAVRESSGDDNEVALLKNMKISWTDDYSSISDDVLAYDYDDVYSLVYEGLSGIEDNTKKDGVPNIIKCLREACYGLASSYDLQHYLMQDFFTYNYDVDALYELEWVSGCDHRFHGDTCVVFDRAAYEAYTNMNK